jgi:site-specific recombinase XerD
MANATGTGSGDKPLTFLVAIEHYIADMHAYGRLTTERSATEYRRTLTRHAEDAEGRAPVATTRDDVKRTLRRWTHPNTQRRMRSMLVSFYDWMVEEALRAENPARQTRAARGRNPSVNRMTLEETQRFLAAARGRIERRVAFLGVCAGLRRNELRLLQGRHFQRDALIWVSGDIAKRGRERWVPVIADLKPVVKEIRATTGPADYILPGTQWVESGRGLVPLDRPERPCHAKTIWRIVRRIGRRAGIAYPVHPHLMRHAFAGHVTRSAGLRAAQAVLGHASIQTTQGYLAAPSLDELTKDLRSVTFLGDAA